jgi:hypothetical protein
VNKFLIKIVGFLTFTLFLLSLLNIWVSANADKNDYYKLQYNEIFNPKINAKNIIIGTSQGTHGIQPEILNDSLETYFNFALDAANPTFYLKWYKNIFRPHYKKPKHILMVVDWFLFDDEWLCRNYEQDSEYFPNAIYFNSLTQKNIDKTMLISNRFPVVKYRKTLITELFNHDLKLFPISKYSMGFIPCEENNEIEEFYPEKININKNVENDFDELIDLIIKDNIKIILVIPPDFHKRPELYKNLITYNYFKNIASKRKIPIINYNVEKISFINSNKNYYTNGNHLNFLGSMEFTKLLKKDLQSVIQ